MIQVIILLVFVLSAASATGSIVLASRLRIEYREEAFSTLLYLLTFYYTFGFYGIWGQIILAFFLKPLISGEALIKTVNIAILMGCPFVILFWTMFIRFFRQIAGKRTGQADEIWLVAGITTVVGIIGYLMGRFAHWQPFDLIKDGFSLLNMTVTILAVLSLLNLHKRKTILHRKDRRILSVALVFTGILEMVLLFLYHSKAYPGILFIAVFFLSGVLLPVYMYYGTDLSILPTRLPVNLSLDELCRKFDISPREKDIIREICLGLSNQQIADKLFISLQTVKDHTHRIYYKTNCNSRTQLITLVNSRAGDSITHENI
jgi:DNA-binding CsgD family transcriptional regulator